MVVGDCVFIYLKSIWVVESKEGEADELEKGCDMVSQKEIYEISVEVEGLRDQLLKVRKITSERVWLVLDRLGEMVERGRGSGCEAQLQVLYSLVESVWMITERQEALAARYRAYQDGRAEGGKDG